MFCCVNVTGKSNLPPSYIYIYIYICTKTNATHFWQANAECKIAGVLHIFRITCSITVWWQCGIDKAKPHSVNYVGLLRLPVIFRSALCTYKRFQHSHVLLPARLVVACIRCLVKYNSCFQVREMLERFENIPDMLESDHLTVSGDVTFGKNVTLKVITGASECGTSKFSLHTKDH